MQYGETQAGVLSEVEGIIMVSKIIDDETRPSPISFPKREEDDDHQIVVINGLSEHGGVNYIL